jgi:hypothetical protein
MYRRDRVSLSIALWAYDRSRRYIC